MAHTKGPWFVNHSPQIFDDARCILQKETTKFIAEIHDTSPQADANARLIAAAPDLLAICKAIKESKLLKGTWPYAKELNRAIKQAEQE